MLGYGKFGGRKKGVIFTGSNGGTRKHSKEWEKKLQAA